MCGLGLLSVMTLTVWYTELNISLTESMTQTFNSCLSYFWVVDSNSVVLQWKVHGRFGEGGDSV